MDLDDEESLVDLDVGDFTGDPVAGLNVDLAVGLLVGLLVGFLVGLFVGSLVGLGVVLIRPGEGLGLGELAAVD